MERYRGPVQFVPNPKYTIPGDPLVFSPLGEVRERKREAHQLSGVHGDDQTNGDETHLQGAFM